MSWFKRQENKIESAGEKTVRTEGLWIKCEAVIKSSSKPISKRTPMSAPSAAIISA